MLWLPLINNENFVYENGNFILPGATGLEFQIPIEKLHLRCNATLARNISAIKSIGDDIGVVLSTLRSKCVQRR